MTDKLDAKAALSLIRGDKPETAAPATGETPLGKEVLEAITVEDKEWADQYQQIIMTLANNLGRAAFGPQATFEQGAQLLDQYTLEIGEHIVSKFRGAITLPEMVGLFGGSIGYQVGVSRSKGIDIPPELPDEAGKIFAIAVKLISIQMAHTLAGTDGGQKLWTPPGT